MQPWEVNRGHACGEWNGGNGRTVPARVDIASTRAALPAGALHEQHLVPPKSLFVDPAQVDLTQWEAA